MENNCKHLCASCQRCNSINTKYPCVIDHMTLLPLKYPEMDMNECVYYMERPEITINTGNIEEENKAELNYIEKNKDNIDKMENFEPHVEELPQINIVNKETGNTLTDEEYLEWKKSTIYKFATNTDDLKKNFYKAYGLKITDDGKVVDKDIETPEDMLLGDIQLDHLEQVTSWKRVLNAARRTVGKEYIDKEPSLSWKAKVLLAEHSPIRLLEYDFGWKKIRQWVTTHLVRHHEGCEKFVHSQRSDRRELPCDRDHIYQGAKNDMDMTCNAQAMINISRKRLCNCASKETREAWKLVMDELSKVDPILKNKCVPECVYRGFCPELQSCGYWKTVQFKKDLAEYRRTKYGDKCEFYVINEGEGRLQCIVENTGHVYKLNVTPKVLSTNEEIKFFEFKTGPIDYKTFTLLNQCYQFEEYKYELHSLYGENGKEPCINEPIIPVSSLVYACFSNDPFYMGVRVVNKMPDIMPKGEEITHIDGNIYNNDIDNLNSTLSNKGEA